MSSTASLTSALRWPHLQNFGSDLGEAQATRGTFKQAHTELSLKFGDAAADGRDRYIEPARRL